MSKKDHKMCSTVLYLPMDFFTLRAPTLSAQIFQQLSDTGVQEQVSNLDQSLSARRVATQQLLFAMSSDPRIEEAIAVASTSLHKGLVQLRNGDISPNRTKKIFSGLLCYISHVASQQERVFYPGSPWNYVKLYCTPAQQEEIIAHPIDDLIRQLSKQNLIDGWFFLRYADPKPHLRLRIHTSESKLIQSALSTLLSWSHQLATQGLIQHCTFDTYEREVARYGGPMAIDLLEQVFSIDSEICRNLIAAQYTHRLTLDPLAVAIYSLDRFFAAWNYDSQRLLHWLQKRTEKYAWSKEFRSKRKLYCELLAPSDEHADPELLAQRNLLHSLHSPLANKLPRLATQVRDLACAGQLWVTEEELLASLTHMHKIRLLDLNTNKELQLYAFWRYTLESISLRPR